MESIVFSNVSEKTDLILQENVESLDEILRSKVEEKPTTEEHEEENVPEGLDAKPLLLPSAMLSVLPTRFQSVQHQGLKNQDNILNFRNEKLKLSNMKSMLNVGDSKSLEGAKGREIGNSASIRLEHLFDKIKNSKLNQSVSDTSKELPLKAKGSEGRESLEAIKQKLINSEEASMEIEDSFLSSLKKESISKHKGAEGGTLPLTVLSTSTLVASAVDAQTKASLQHGSVLEAKIQTAIENRKMLETSSMDSSSLTYRFQRWGGDFSVNIQPQSGAMMLSPSDALVEQKLNDNWQSGNPNRWHLVQEENREGRQSQNQHMTEDEED